MRKRPVLVTALSLAAWLTAGAPAAPDAPAELRQPFAYDAAQPLDAQLTPLYERDGAKVYDLLYTSPKGGKVTGYLVVPAMGQGPRAGIVFGHWGGGDRTEFLPEAALYARAGAVSVMIDYPWNRPAPWRVPQGRGLDEPEKDRDSWIHAVVDLQRAADLLQARPDVDPKRLGYVGHSYGAQWGAILSAVDRRFVALALMAGVPTQESMIVESGDPDMAALRERSGPQVLERYLVLNRPFDAIRYVPHAAPAPLLFQFARHERILTEAAMRRYAGAGSQPKEVLWYDTGHDLNDPRALVDRALWLGPKLGLAPLRPLLEGLVR